MRPSLLKSGRNSFMEENTMRLLNCLHSPSY